MVSPIDHGVLQRTIKKVARDVTASARLLRVLVSIGSAIGNIPTWPMQLFVGLMWLFMVVVAIGKGQDWAVFCSLFGMLWWSLMERDLQALRHDMNKALDGWSETINQCRELERELRLAQCPLHDCCGGKEGARCLYYE